MIEKKTFWSIVIGIVIGGLVLVGAYLLVSTVVQDHAELQQVVTFINNSIAAQQKAAQPTDSAVVTAPTK